MEDQEIGCVVKSQFSGTIDGAFSLYLHRVEISKQPSGAFYKGTKS